MGGCCSSEQSEEERPDFTDLQEAKRAHDAKSAEVADKDKPQVSSKPPKTDVQTSAASGDQVATGDGKPPPLPAKPSIVPQIATAAESAGVSSASVNRVAGLASTASALPTATVATGAASQGEGIAATSAPGDGESAADESNSSFVEDYAPESSVGGNPLFHNPNIPSSFKGIDSAAATSSANGAESPLASRSGSQSFRLVYFPIQGQAEAVRLALELANASYETEVLDAGKWNASSARFPLEALPVLEVAEQGRTISTAREILEYLAESLQLLPEGDKLEEAKGLVLDSQELAQVTVELRKAILESNDSKKDQCASQAKEISARVLPRLESAVKKEAGSLFFEKPSLVDVCAFDALDQLSRVDSSVLAIDVSQEYPSLAQFTEHFSNLDSIARYLDSSKRYPF